MSDHDTRPESISLGHRVVRRLARERFLTALLALNFGLFFTMAIEMISETQSKSHLVANLIIMIVIAVVMVWVLANLAKSED